MPLNPMITLMGDKPDLMGGVFRANEQAYTQGQRNRENAFQRFQQQQGAALTRGDQGALDQFAQFDPTGAFNMRGAVDDRARAEQQRRAAAAAAAQNAQAAQQSDQIKQVLAIMDTAYDAGPEAFAQVAAQNGLTETLAQYNVGYGNYHAGSAGLREQVGYAAQSFPEAQGYVTVGDSRVPDDQPYTAPTPLSDIEVKAQAAGIDLNTPKGEAWLTNQNYDWDGEEKLRAEWTKLPAVKDFVTRTTAYGSVVASVENPSPAGDLSLIFNFMKTLDPGSVVRESEFQLAAASGDYGDRIQAAMNQALNGQRLSEDVRNDFVARAGELYESGISQYENLRGQYEGIANDRGLSVARALPKFEYSGAAASTGNGAADAAVSQALGVTNSTMPTTFAARPEIADFMSGSGKTAEEIWNAFTPEQQKLWD